MVLIIIEIMSMGSCILLGPNHSSSVQQNEMYHTTIWCNLFNHAHDEWVRVYCFSGMHPPADPGFPPPRCRKVSDKNGGPGEILHFWTQFVRFGAYFLPTLYGKPLYLFPIKMLSIVFFLIMLSLWKRESQSDLPQHGHKTQQKYLGTYKSKKKNTLFMVDENATSVVLNETS